MNRVLQQKKVCAANGAAAQDPPFWRTLYTQHKIKEGRWRGLLIHTKANVSNKANVDFLI